MLDDDQFAELMKLIECAEQIPPHNDEIPPDIFPPL